MRLRALGGELAVNGLFAFFVVAQRVGVSASAPR
jgi:hypothetical protein